MRVLINDTQRGFYAGQMLNVFPVFVKADGTHMADVGGLATFKDREEAQAYLKEILGIDYDPATMSLDEVDTEERFVTGEQLVKAGHVEIGNVLIEGARVAAEMARAASAEDDDLRM